MDSLLNKFDGSWKALPLKVQYKYLLIFFLGYALVTMGMILKVVHDARKSNQGIIIEHIENPVIKKNESATSLWDSLLMIKKNKTHERN